MNKLDLFKEPYKYCAYYITDNNEKLLENLIQDYVKPYVLYKCKGMNDDIIKMIYSNFSKSTISKTPKCIIFDNIYDIVCNKSIIYNHKFYTSSIILKNGGTSIPSFIRHNIDYIIISKNTKNLKYIFEKFIKERYIGVSFVIFLGYLEKYPYLIVGYCDKDGNYCPKMYQYIPKKNEAARIIQNGTIGIVPRLGFLGKF